MVRCSDGPMVHNMYYRTRGVQENGEAGGPPDGSSSIVLARGFAAPPLIKTSLIASQW